MFKLTVRLLVTVLLAILAKLALIRLPKLELFAEILPVTVKPPLLPKVAATVGLILPVDVV